MRRFEGVRASAAAALLIAFAGCGPNGSSGSGEVADAGADVVSIDIGGNADGAIGATDAQATDGADATASPVFLAPSQYATLMTLDPSLPFGVTQMHAADDAIAGCHWGGPEGRS
jgi:hypothetical protein